LFSQVFLVVPKGPSTTELSGASKGIFIGDRNDFIDDGTVEDVWNEARADAWQS
jgi:hypothetical protein